MRRFTTLLSAVLLLGGCTAASSSTKSAAHVIVPANQLPRTFGLSGWSPTEGQIAACEVVLGRALAEKKHDPGSYYLRLGDIVRHGTRHIVGIGADSNTGTYYLQPASDETIVLPPFGGGETFFSFDYDSETGKLMTLEFNESL
ncbi:MAG TPA: hypothetical protein VGM64_04650 [Lacunisphaera sp.]|jgi:hypothetical protein